MEYVDTVFNAHGEAPKVKMYNIDRFYYIKLLDKFGYSGISLYVNKEDFTHFKNNVLWAYEKFMRKEKGGNNATS